MHSLRWWKLLLSLWTSTSASEEPNNEQASSKHKNALHKPFLVLTGLLPKMILELLVKCAFLASVFLRFLSHALGLALQILHALLQLIGVHATHFLLQFFGLAFRLPRLLLKE